MTLRSEVSPPFGLRRVAVEELLPGPARPGELDDLADAVDRNCRRRDPAGTVAALDGHDRAILAHLRGHKPAGKSKTGTGTAGAHTLVREESE